MLKNLRHASALMALVASMHLGGKSLWGQESVDCPPGAFDPYATASIDSSMDELQVLPDGLIYRPYLAGQKESRTSIQYFNDKDNGWSWYSVVGGQLGILRYGNDNPFMPVGVQFDVEGSAQFSVNGAKLLDLLSTDARLGFPLSIGWGTQETKLALYFLHTNPHRSYLEDRPELPERLFDRRAIVLGHAIHPFDSTRLYGEVGYAFSSNLNASWEFQFGAEYAPMKPTRFWGAPFAAANAYLLETDKLASTLTIQAGWAWRGEDTRLLRVGLFYLNGRSNNLVEYSHSNQQIGLGIWHDF